MRDKKRLTWAVGLLLAAALLFSTGTSAQVGDPCEELEHMLEAGWPEGTRHSLDEVRSIIERGDAERCDELISTISPGEQQARIGREGYLLAEAEEIDLEALAGLTVYGMNDESLGEISDIALSPDGRVDDVVIDLGGFLGLGAKPVSVDFDQLAVLREEEGDELRVYLDSTREELEQMEAYEMEMPEEPAPSALPPVDLAEVRASRAFVALDNALRTDFAGFGMVAFRRSPAGSLLERATHLCRGFLIGISPVSVLLESGTTLDQQVVTAWPVEGADQASEMNEAARAVADADEVCEDAVLHYDWTEGDNAVEEAADFFRARGKDEIAEKLAAPDQDGPWLLAWAPGAKKGSTHDDVLVLAFDLSHVSTQAEAERAFQAWRVAIEQNPELWSAATIANQTWNSAIIRWANMIGRDLDFYNLMRQ